LRIDHVQLHFAAGARRELLQEFPHAHAVGCDLGNLRCGLLRVVEVQVDRLPDAFQDPVRAGCRGVEVILREIQPPAAQCVVEENRQADEQKGEREQGTAAEC
jgi:hypothetical protein